MYVVRYRCSYIRSFPFKMLQLLYNYCNNTIVPISMTKTNTQSFHTVFSITIEYSITHIRYGRLGRYNFIMLQIKQSIKLFYSTWVQRTTRPIRNNSQMTCVKLAMYMHALISTKTQWQNNV